MRFLHSLNDFTLRLTGQPLAFIACIAGIPLCVIVLIVCWSRIPKRYFPLALAIVCVAGFSLGLAGFFFRVA